MKQIVNYAVKNISETNAHLVLIVLDDDSARYVSMLSAPKPKEFIEEWFPKARNQPWTTLHRHYGAIAGSEDVLSTYELMSYYVTYAAYRFKVDLIVGNNSHYHIETLASTTQMLERLMRHSMAEGKSRLGVQVTNAEGEEILTLIATYPDKENE